MQRTLAIADDLSGAAETAAAFLQGSTSATGSPARSAQEASGKAGTKSAVSGSAAVETARPDDVGPYVCLLPHHPQQLASALSALPSGTAPLILDTDNRRFPAEDAADRLRQVLAAQPGGAEAPRVFLKIDSLLRGPLASQLQVLATGGPVILAPALPPLGRTTVDGVVLHQGVPLHRTKLWHAEPAGPPATVAAAISPITCTQIGLEAVRGSTDDLRAALLTATAGALAAAGAVSPVVICDAETSADLAAIARAAQGVPNVRFAGASALAAALAAFNAPPAALDKAAFPGQPPAVGPSLSSEEADTARFPLVVVGSASGAAQQQLQALAADGVPVLTVTPAELLAGTADITALETALAHGPAAISVESATVDPQASAGISAALANALGGVAAGRPLFLTGGETARTVLDALGVRQLHVISEVEHGTVLSRTPDGIPIVTRPGSFGGRDSLRIILAALSGHPASLPSRTAHPPRTPLLTASPPSLPVEGLSMNVVDSAELPVVAITMGDGAGVGPEVVVAAVLDPQSNAECRPVVIGDALRLRQAADILGIEADIEAIATINDAVFTPGRVNVIDLALLPEDLPWGELSPVAGHAAYEYIRVASELAMAGTVQAICTAPLNKEALHAAGHIFPGHTELLAQLTGTGEVSMMLSTPKIKVIHVTTHIGLMDAVRKINPDLVQRTIRRGHEALIRAGIPEPKIGVCAINPHAGENGLFGQGEEAEKIEPGVKAAQAEGINVTGPLPADTLFFLAGRGDYDLVVAMYHDQGHGPVKVLGIEAGVNITVGLPVIRTSVDHGTAFDIAGKAIADSRSMVEALHQAAEMATRPAVAV